MERIKVCQGWRRKTKAQSRCFSSQLCDKRWKLLSGNLKLLGQLKDEKMWFFFSCCSPNSKDKVNLPSCRVHYFLGQAPQVCGASTATCGWTTKRSATLRPGLNYACDTSFRQRILTLEGMSAGFLGVLATPNWQGCVKRTEVILKLQRKTWNVWCWLKRSGRFFFKCKACSWNQISGRRKCLRCVSLINAVKQQEYKHCILLNEEQRAQYRWPKYIYCIFACSTT